MQLSEKCPSCQLVQFIHAKCKRCNKNIPLEAQEPAPIMPIMTFPDQMPTWDELEAAFINEAIRRTGSHVKAAAMLGMGKDHDLSEDEGRRCAKGDLRWRSPKLTWRACGCGVMAA